MVLRFSYNKRLQPVTMSAVSPSATLFSLTYDFHPGAGNNGNVYAITNNKDATRNQTFGYDQLNRLISAQNNGTDCSKLTLNVKTEYWGNNYSYDAWGNLLSKIITKCGGENLSLTAGSNNQLQGGYVYDAAGNMIHDATANLNYTFDQENRITGANGFTYTYDADGNRVAKVTPPPPAQPTSGTLYWYMSPGIVAESDLTGNLQSEYVFFNGERVARRDNPTGANSTVAYYFADHLKTTDIVTDALGNIKNESDFYPWGRELQFLANDSNHYKFTGKERDSETGLDYFGARYYSNGLGRFVTPDPLLNSGRPGNPQTWNRYAYTLNNPLRYVDPTGLYEWQSQCGKSDSACENAREQFRTALAAVKAMAGEYKEGSDERKAIDRVLKAYGTEGDGNKVSIAFGNAGGDVATTTMTQKGGTITVTIDLEASHRSFGNRTDGTNEAVEFIGTVAHEGTHVADDQQRGGPVYGRRQELTTERNANNAESFINRRFNTYSPDGLWNPSWVEADKETLRKAGVERAAQRDTERAMEKAKEKKQ